MLDVTTRAAGVLKMMEPDRGYSVADLQALAPELSADALREVMHELWIARAVERFRGSGWRRVRTPPRNAVVDRVALRVGAVKPEDLFDHDAFAEWFR